MILLRLVAGLALGAHGAQKLFGSFGGGGLSGTRSFFTGLGFPTPFVTASAAGELAGGLLFALGLATPLATLALVVVMLNAIGTVHWRKGFFNSAGGYEYNLLIIATALAVTAGGPGRFSLDAALGWVERISGPWWARGDRRAGLRYCTGYVDGRPRPAEICCDALRGCRKGLAWTCV
jgi:putative oxidoreductase